MPKPMAAFIYSTEMERYHYPDECPFNTRRAGLTRARCDSMGLLDGSDRVEVEPVMATRSEAEWYHVPRYLDALQRADEGHFGAEEFSMGLGTADCPVFRGMYPGALLASGASITGARLILSGEAMRVFNPSGGLHHAHADHASGFCYINDIVLAAIMGYIALPVTPVQLVATSSIGGNITRTVIEPQKSISSKFSHV